MRLRTALLTAVVSGIACAVGLAVALRDTGAATAGESPAATTAATVAGHPPPAPTAAAAGAPTTASGASASGSPRIAPARGRRLWEVVTGAAHVATRVEDPDGGPAWVVRRYAARERLVPRDGGSRVGQPMSCAQLGRVVDGRVGWIDGTDVFRPVPVGTEGAPSTCTVLPRRGGPLFRPPSQRLMRITDPASSSAQPLQNVVWGMTDPRLGKVLLDVHGRGQYPHGPGVEYRVPDPNGGLPWGLPVTGRAGRPACQAWLGRVVGDRVGRVDYRLGTLSVYGPENESGCATSPPTSPLLSESRPLALLTSSDPGPGLDPSERARRGVRRTLQGLTTVVGMAHPDVVSVTIETPRDVRTLTPSAGDHVFAAVYDGGFPSGHIVVIAHMRDGSRRRVVAGPFRP